MNHLNEHTLELYVLRADSVNKRRKEIARHLRECAGCSVLHAEIEAYYSQVDALEREQARKASHALYAPERTIRRPTMGDAAPIVPVRRTMPQRFVESLRQYPVRWSFGLAVVVAIVALVVPQLVHRDQNPAYARPRNEFLIAYNNQGEELWKQRIGLGIDDGGLPGYLTEENSRGFPVVDVDRDGQNELFGVFGWANWGEQRNPYLRSLVCYHADGSERWRYELHRQVSLGGVPFSDDYRFYQIRVGDFDGNGQDEVIGFGSHIPWFPNVLVRLDARDGRLLGEYWHNGMLPWAEQRDIDGDGVHELFLGGQNNRLQQACLAVLDPRAFEGHGPAPPEYRPDGVSPGREKFYVVLPASDLKAIWRDITNEVTAVHWRSDSTLEVVVSEYISSALDDTASAPRSTEGTIYFYFDQSMRCVRVRASDAFSGVRAKYHRRGLVKGEIDAAYLERLRQGVRYWDGGKFVSEPVMNRLYSMQGSGGAGVKGRNGMVE